MKKLNPEFVNRMAQIMNSCPYYSLLSMKVREAGSGFAILEIDVDEKHRHAFNFVHGGVFASIIDSATFWAVLCSVEDQDSSLVSVDLKVNYLAPASSGQLIAKARTIKVGKKLGYAEAEVTGENGKILAHGTSILMILPGKGNTGDPALPPKFLE